MFTKRLLKLLKENRIRNSELANYLKVSKSAVSKWLNGQAVPRADTLRQMAKLFKVSVGYLINNEEFKPIGKDNNEIRNNIFPSIVYTEEEPNKIDGFVWLPLYETKISATPGIQDIIREDIIGWHSAPESLAGSINDPLLRPFSMKVTGNSMYPLIRPGDYLTIKPSPFILPEENQIYAVKINDDLSNTYGIVVKRVQLETKRKVYLLRSDNPEFPVFIADENNATIVGRVISLWRPL